jgi:hypothetical protein
MKRVSVSSILLFFSLALLGAYPLDYTDVGTAGSGSAGLALTSYASSFANPAALYFRNVEDSSFYVSTQYGDEFDSGSFENDEPNPLIQNPVSDLCVSFSGSNLALTIQAQTTLSDRTVSGDSTYYTATSETLFQLDWAIGRRNLAFGLSFRAVSFSERDDIEISDDRTLGDYFVETVLGRYDVLENEAIVSAGMGLLLNYDWFKVAVCSDAFAYAQGDDSLEISSESLFKTFCWGFGFSSPTYDSNNQLNLFKVESALDLIDIGDQDSRELRFGVDLKLQLLPFWSVSLKTGYREMKPDLTDFFAFDPENGTHTLGLSVQLNKTTIDLACSIPVEWYMGDDDSSVSATLALSFAV